MKTHLNPSFEGNSATQTKRALCQRQSLQKSKTATTKAAIKILTSETKPASNSAETLLNLQNKHPRPAAYKHLPPHYNLHKPLQVTEANILQAIRSFPAGSSGGPDGLRPQHILELATCKEIGTGLVSSIKAFINLLLEGKCHDEVAQIIFSGSFIALTKKSGGIHPLGHWLRMAKISCKVRQYVRHSGTS